MSRPSSLDGIRIVLSHTSHPGNIGAAARAMKTMGLSRLALVRPKHFPHADAVAFAAGATDVLDAAMVCESLDEALAGTVFAVAATARRRDLSPESLDCREACGRLVAEAAHADVALVFGTERSGLTTAEISRCHAVSTIATDPGYSSLNLAQAVQVFAYELRMGATSARVPAPREDALATHEEAEGFLGQLEDAFYATGFLDPAEPKRLMQRMRRLFGRARMQKTEVNVLRGFLSAVRAAADGGRPKG